MSEPSGVTGQPFTIDIERGKIREFAMATKARDRSYFEDARPVIPPTFLASAAFWMTPESSVLDAIQVDWARILHGEQEYTFYGPPPRAGQTLIAQQRIEDQYEKQGRRGGTMRFIIILTEFRTPAGDLVAESHTTVIETSQVTP
jgi:N-terminal half of MaoC dehydratase